MEVNTVRKPISSYVRIARLGFIFFAWLLTACLLAQLFFAGIAVFVNVGDWSLHTGFVRMFSLLPLVMFALSFAAKLPPKLRLQCAGLFVFVIAQFLTAIFSKDIGFAAALHPVIGVGMFVGSLFIAQQSNMILREEQ
jgi:hypothetical protein